MATDYEIEAAELAAIAQRDEGSWEKAWNTFAQWFSRSEGPLRASLRTFAPAVDVESILRDVGLVVWHKAPVIVPDGRPEFLLRYARVVAVNRARNEAKRVNGWNPLPDSDLPGPDARSPDLGLRRQIHDCLDHLDAKLREAIRARIADEGEHPDRVLAEGVGVAFDTFRKRLSRGREALRKCLASSGIDVAEYVR